MSDLAKTLLFIFCFLVAVNAARAQNVAEPGDDAQILKVISIIDQNESKIADLAQGKNIDPVVLHYAKLIQIDHQMNLDWDKELTRYLGSAPPQDSALITHWRNLGQDILIKLAPLDKDDFSREFIWELIRGYSNALVWIYSQNPQDKQIKMFLEDTKQRLALHLKRAQQLREEVLDNPG
ncbi:MAG: DUF4142 domain-containing protein [Candidatus Omnitrophica bacterium]|nr:DUF4142 domain-containing protein [Candidatus Omnitrophota bacterium]MDE2222918.1 DUF4142 domain-containing protein [Candidatus Omnitrophota bacterium]